MSRKKSSRKRKPALDRTGVTPPEPSPSPGRVGFYVPTLILFFFAGSSALIYEVVWGRMLVLVLGNTTLATSTILASFMAGLGLGAYFWGRYIENRPGRPLKVFAGLKIGEGLFGLVFPLLLPLITPVDVWLSGQAAWGYYPSLLLRFLMVFILLLPPTFLMGGALAVMGRYLITREDKFGRDSSLLYGADTAGAAIGALLTGFYLIKTVGHGGSVYVAAGLNLAVGLLAFLLDCRRPVTATFKKRKSDRRTRAARPSRAAVLFVVLGMAVSGFCALAYQVLWTRLLLLVMDNSVYSFTIVLAAFLTGISLGGLLLAPLFRYIGRPVLVLALLQIGIGVSAWFFPLFRPDQTGRPG